MSALSEEYTRILLAELRDGADMRDALLDVTRRHADHLRALGPIRILALDPCPICMSQVIASDTEARCTTCSWTHHKGAAA